MHESSLTFGSEMVVTLVHRPLAPRPGVVQRAWTSLACIPLTSAGLGLDRSGGVQPPDTSVVAHGTHMQPLLVLYIGSVGTIGAVSQPAGGATVAMGRR